MILNFKLVKVDYKYCDYLRKYDNRVAYNKDKKELRPFVGVLFEINDVEYFAPLTSPKPKHLRMKNTIDFLRIDGGKLGAINFNNMIPVTVDNYSLVDLNKKVNSVSERKYQKLLREKLDWLNENYTQIKNKSFKLYKLYNDKRLSSNIMDRCCDFKLLEEKCIIYNKKMVEVA